MPTEAFKGPNLRGNLGRFPGLSDCGWSVCLALPRRIQVLSDLGQRDHLLGPVFLSDLLDQFLIELMEVELLETVAGALEAVFYVPHSKRTSFARFKT